MYLDQMSDRHREIAELVRQPCKPSGSAYMARTRPEAKADKPPRDKQITLRLPEREHKAFRARAEELDLDMTTWIRLVCRKAANLETP